MKNIIEKKIKTALSPEKLEVIDESHQHVGHGGWREGGNTHFRIKIKAATLNNKTRVAQHQAIMRLLKDEFDNGLHALAIDVLK